MTVSLPLKVLVSSASKKIPLVRAMQSAVLKIHPEAKVVAGDISPDALSFYVADEYWVMPCTIDENLDHIILGCCRRGINVVLPTRDSELLFWARHIDRFRASNIVVLVSPVDSIEVCVDKQKFSDFGCNHGLPFIPSSPTLDGVNDCRYVVKERFGSGSRSIGLNLSRSDAAEHGRLLESALYQPYFIGQEISVDAWLSRSHKLKGLVLRRRDYIVNGESQITTTFRHAEIEMQAKEILEALRLSGPVVLQAIVTDDDKIHAIECNARFGGASTAAIAVGLDCLYWSLLEVLGNNIENYPFARLSNDVRQVRVPSDLYFNV